MTTIPSGRVHTSAVIDALRGAGLTVGNATGAGLAPPYVVVYGDLGRLDGPLGDRFADLTGTVQLTSVGVGPEQAQGTADLARRALLGTPVAVEGRAVLYLRHVMTRTVERDDDVAGSPLFYAIDDYQIATTPGG